MKPAWIASGRIPSLDGLRGISILLVTISHLPDMAGTDFFLPAKFLLVHGDIGVDVFFVISGFLITHLLLSEQEKRGRISLKGFYWRRTLRIFPAYYFFLGVVAILAWWRLCPMSGWAWVASLTYTVDFMRDPSPFAIGHLWSLAVEEQFYLLWPGTLILAGKRHARTVLLACLFVCPILRFMGWHYWQSYVDIDYFFPTRMDTIAVGCLLAFFVRTELATRLSKRVASFATPLIVGLSGIIAISVVLSASGKYGLGPAKAVEAFSIAGIILLAATRTESIAAKVLNWGPLAFVGVLSYSLYLAQMFLPLGWNVAPWVPLAVALGYALLSHYAIEQPFLRLKAKGEARNSAKSHSVPVYLAQGQDKT